MLGLLPRLPHRNVVPLPSHDVLFALKRVHLLHVTYETTYSNGSQLINRLKATLEGHELPTY